MCNPPPEYRNRGAASSRIWWVWEANGRLLFTFASYAVLYTCAPPLGYASSYDTSESLIDGCLELSSGTTVGLQKEVPEQFPQSGSNLADGIWKRLEYSSPPFSRLEPSKLKPLGEKLFDCEVACRD